MASDYTGLCNLAICGTSLGLYLPIPNMELTLPTPPPPSPPPHPGGKSKCHHFSGQSEHSSQPHPPTVPSTTQTHSRCLLSICFFEQNTWLLLMPGKTETSIHTKTEQFRMCALGPQGLGSNPDSATDLLCALGQLTHLHSVSLSLSVKWD